MSMGEVPEGWWNLAGVEPQRRALEGELDREIPPSTRYREGRCTS